MSEPGLSRYLFTITSIFLYISGVMLSSAGMTTCFGVSAAPTPALVSLLMGRPLVYQDKILIEHCSYGCKDCRLVDRHALKILLDLRRIQSANRAIPPFFVNDVHFGMSRDQGQHGPGHISHRRPVDVGQPENSL